MYVYIYIYIYVWKGSEREEREAERERKKGGHASSCSAITIFSNTKHVNPKTFTSLQCPKHAGAPSARTSPMPQEKQKGERKRDAFWVYLALWFFIFRYVFPKQRKQLNPPPPRHFCFFQNRPRLGLCSAVFFCVLCERLFGRRSLLETGKSFPVRAPHAVKASSLREAVLDVGLGFFTV